MNQLQLSDLDTPYLPSASKIKVQCRVEISQSNSSSGGIQPCSMVQGHQPNQVSSSTLLGLLLIKLSLYPFLSYLTLFPVCVKSKHSSLASPSIFKLSLLLPLVISTTSLHNFSALVSLL
ncbi:hypothetical protein PCANC_20308 [Puccinia coronata f. sp. avenae]|uniref:Uncharacterized protein n=1 Tax=Puccinia coronata f. sp. avenae TaxID=200324 RepID=A0A2N5SDD0_9BASI|nr:hypothetical protein PCANC_20308 [Puccinia coronata f. sp. avenae]